MDFDMNNIGNKIRKIRELKNIPPKDIADQLDMSPQNYLKIERDEVNLSVDRLLQISEIFGMKVEEVLTFDEKMVFNNHGEIKGGVNVQSVNNGSITTFPEEMKLLYEDKISLLEEKIKWLEEKIRGSEKK